MSKTKKVILYFSLLLILVFVSCYAFTIIKQTQDERRSFEKRKASWKALNQKIAYEINNFKGDAGIVIKDLQTNWEIFYNKDKLFPSASLAKIPVMAALFLAEQEGKFNPDQVIILKFSDKLSGSGILKYMRPGIQIEAEKLVGLMIYDSDNTAANILTNLTSIEYLDSSFKTLGLKNTNLSRKIADFKSRDRGIENFTTAYDMSYLLEKMYQRTLINKKVSDKCLSLLKLQRINDRIPKYLPIDVVCAHKTGLEKGVCHDAGIVFTGKGNFLICVLTKHKSPNNNKAKEFIARVSYHAYKYLNNL